MFRERQFQQARDFDVQDVWPVLNPSERTSPAIGAPDEHKLPFRAAPAAPDVPAAVGVMLFGVYLLLVAALALATAGPGESKFAIAIAGLFVVAFFSVPRLMLAQEQDNGGRTSMERFLSKGIETFTGHCSGRAALVQMFVVPVTLIAGILMIAIVVAISG